MIVEAPPVLIDRAEVCSVREAVSRFATAAVLLQAL